MKRWMLVAGLVLLWTLGATFTLGADLSMKDYDRLMNDASFRSYMNGVGTGFQYANALLMIRNQQRLFCTSDNVALKEDDYLDILARKIKELKAKKPRADLRLPTVLLMGLQEAFPCDK